MPQGPFLPHDPLVTGLCGREDSNLHCLSAPGPKPGASPSCATPAGVADLLVCRLSGPGGSTGGRRERPGRRSSRKARSISPCAHGGRADSPRTDAAPPSACSRPTGSSSRLAAAAAGAADTDGTAEANRAAARPLPRRCSSRRGRRTGHGSQGAVGTSQAVSRSKWPSSWSWSLPWSAGWSPPIARTAPGSDRTKHPGAPGAHRRSQPSPQDDHRGSPRRPACTVRARRDQACTPDALGGPHADRRTAPRPARGEGRDRGAIGPIGRQLRRPPCRQLG